MIKKVIPFVYDIDESLALLWIKYLQEEMNEYQIVAFKDLSKEQIQASDVAIVANPKPSQIAQMKNLKWVQSLWAGVEKLLLDIPNASFKIARMTDPLLADTMAQSVLAWTLYLHKNMPLYKKQQSLKLWKQHIELLPQEKSVLVLGLGKLKHFFLGQEVKNILKE